MVGKARLAYGGGVSCGAGAVRVVAHGFVRARREAGESVLYSKLAMRRLLAGFKSGWMC